MPVREAAQDLRGVERGDREAIVSDLEAIVSGLVAHDGLPSDVVAMLRDDLHGLCCVQLNASYDTLTQKNRAANTLSALMHPRLATTRAPVRTRDNENGDTLNRDAPGPVRVVQRTDTKRCASGAECHQEYTLC